MTGLIRKFRLASPHFLSPRHSAPRERSNPAMRSIRKALLLLAAVSAVFVLLALVFDEYAVAADIEAATNECAYTDLDPFQYGGKPYRDARVIGSKDGHLEGELTVKYADHVIAGCKTHLRNYNGELIGPTLHVKPGDTIDLTLHNGLPVDKTPPPPDMNTPHNFNVTNFHSHGLHVSPDGNSDNVLITVDPQKTWHVEISVPLDHPTGTFWYHAHVHGSTALQVSSGMAGALIVENPDDPKSPDSLPAIKAAKEQTMVLQQISYNEQGQIENYNNFGPGGWEASKRLATVNGQIMPEIVMQPGEVRRWRLIHGGVRETFQVGVVDPQFGPDTKHNWTLNEIAIDGLALGHIDGWKQVELEPGYRSDVLVRAPLLAFGQKEKVYYLTDLPADAENALLDSDKPLQLLARIVVRGAVMHMKLPCAANGPCPAMAGMRPHKDVADSEIDPANDQAVHFDIAKLVCPEAGKPCQPCPDPKAGDCKFRFMVNGIPFSEGNVRKLKLGTAAEWSLSASEIAGHPFHIHVNPFQMTRKDPLGQDEIVWRDTLFVHEGAPAVKTRTRYERYIGKFVLHCHILDHEDQGMMQLVEIEPDSVPMHHH